MSKLSNFYKSHMHIFYNIDYIESKYKDNCRYKNEYEFNEYLQKKILNVNEKQNEKQNILREIIKKTIYDLFDKSEIEKEITLEQFIRLVNYVYDITQDREISQKECQVKTPSQLVKNNTKPEISVENEPITENQKNKKSQIVNSNNQSDEENKKPQDETNSNKNTQIKELEKKAQDLINNIKTKIPTISSES